MKEVELTQGYVAIVDDEDFDLVNKYSWNVMKFKTSDNLYAQTTIWNKGDRKSVLMHRLLLPDAILVDHIDGNGLNNRKYNLRRATHSQNSRNSRKHKIGKSKYKGVCSIYGKWRALITVGTFNNEVDAAKAYDEAARKCFGEFAKTNFETSDGTFFDREGTATTTSMD